MLEFKILIFDILVHITFLFIILCFFFFLVGFKKEKEALISNIESNTDKFVTNNETIKAIKSQYKFLEPEAKISLKQKLIKQIENSKFESRNKNKWFLALGIIICIVLFCTTSYYGFYIVNRNFISKNKLIEIVINTFILFVIICIIEVLFFFMVIMKYQPILNSDINNTFIQKYNMRIPTLIKNIIPKIIKQKQFYPQNQN